MQVKTLFSLQNLLPVKWMALESLLYDRFTTASDVYVSGQPIFTIFKGFPSCHGCREKK